jgi:hypothetical protein
MALPAPCITDLCPGCVLSHRYTANTRKNLQSEAEADLMKVPLLRELLTKR